MASSENATKAQNRKDRAYLGNGQQNNPLANPCIMEQNLSLNCVTESYEDKNACKIYFANYNACRMFWNSVMRDRRLAGIKPYLPLPEERDAIKAKAMTSLK